DWKEAKLCRDLQQARRHKFPLYPSRYRCLLVEVPLSANRGAGLAHRFTVMWLAARPMLWPASVPLAPIGRRGASFVRQTHVNSYVDVLRQNFFTSTRTFLRSRCAIRR